jgi:YrbI family 3-deoxy-D-manno-octulosonate 8-phosphate phosphatase
MNKNLDNIKLIFSDVDGVLTDGGLYYNADGEALKKFNVKDGLIARVLQKKGFRLGIMTGRKSPFVETRFKELNYEFIIQGIPKKLIEMQRVLKETGLNMENIAYIGDDLNDEELMKHVGFAACPADAADEIKLIADFISTKKGGDGAFREFADLILKNTQS